VTVTLYEYTFCEYMFCEYTVHFVSICFVSIRFVSICFVKLPPLTHQLFHETISLRDSFFLVKKGHFEQFKPF
jgi:hypothetical protein